MPPAGRILLLRPPAGLDPDLFPPDRTVAVTGFRPDHDALAAAGFAVADAPEGSFAAAFVSLPRAKALARDLVARAAGAVGDGGAVVVDGAKTDGVESLLRAVREVATVGEVVSKAHGKCFTATANAALRAWREAPTRVDGFLVPPGGFSADGVDPGTAALIDALPPLRGRVCDLGAGWGALAAAILARSPEVAALDLVEAERAALDCARANVADPRAAFHWADATRWEAAPYDAVATNPPFHAGRVPDPALGQAFVRAAARLLAPSGRLFLVANRRLPYEAALEAAFAEVAVRAEGGGYKVIEAARPRRGGRRGQG